MPALDLYHAYVRGALIAEGWMITHDPYTIPFGGDNVFVDLAAERTLAAQKGSTRIAVEVKSFLGTSGLRDFELSLGQYVLYRSLMSRVDPDRALYLAVPVEAYDATFRKPIVEVPLLDMKVSLCVFNPVGEEALRWIP